MSSKLQKYLSNNNKNRVFVNKTFSDFRKDLLRYANEFYSENILDFSETSVGGMFLDFASLVGDSLVYYAEQQFNEMNYETATDPENIARFVKQANIKNISASPSSVDITIQLTIPAKQDQSINTDYLPVIKKNSTMSARNGTRFILSEDVDFSKGYTVDRFIDDDLGNTISYVVTKNAICESGTIGEETVNFSNNSGKFLSFELENEDITKILNVKDNDNNEYYEVEYLSQDFIYKKIENVRENYLTIKAAPYRYISERDIDTGRITIRFGSGDNTTLPDGVIPDITDLLLPMKNSNATGLIEFSPTTVLSSNLLGISPKGKDITVTYKYGGGTLHNVSANSINNVENMIMTFPNVDTLDDVSAEVTNSVSINNKYNATGGANKPELEELKTFIQNAKNMQSRIVTHEDLLTSLVAFPSDFGKVYKAAAIDNKHFVNLKDIFIVCKNNEGHYVNASDALKINISKYINENRLIGDNFNLVDVPIFNFGIRLKIRINEGFNERVSIFQITREIIRHMKFGSLDIGEEINVGKLIKIVDSHPSVNSIITPRNKIITSKSTESGFFDFERNVSLEYSQLKFNPVTSFYEGEGIIYPERGGIFELKYPARDIEILTSN